MPLNLAMINGKVVMSLGIPLDGKHFSNVTRIGAACLDENSKFSSFTAIGSEAANDLRGRRSTVNERRQDGQGLQINSPCSVGEARREGFCNNATASGSQVNQANERQLQLF